MAQLTIKNVAAPNLSGTSQILANAAASLNSGLAAASGVLDKYAAGQQESADASVLSTIAGISSEEELGKFLGSGQLEGLNLSPAMRETVLGLRKGILANDQTRANIGQTQANTGLIGANTDRVRASTAIAQAAEGRTAAEYQDGVNVRNARRALTPAVVGANIEGNQQGQPQITPTNFDFKRYATGGAQRSDSFNGMTPSMQNGLAGLLSTADSEIGKGLQVYSGYRSADVQAGIVSQNMNKYGLGSRRNEWENDVRTLGAAAAGQKWRPIMREAGLTKFVAMPGGSKHQTGQAADLKWNGQRLDQAPAAVRDWVKQNASRFGLAVPMAHEPWQVETSDARSGGTTNAQAVPSNQRPAFNNLQQAIAQSVYLDPADAQKLLADAYSAQKLGQTRIDAANAAAQQEASAAAILAAVQDPNNINTQGVVTDLINNPAVGNSNERIEAIARAQGLAGQDGPLSGVLSPRVSTDETIRNSIELFNGREGANIASSVQTRLLNDAQNYVEDPAGTLISQFGMEATPELRNDLRTTINNLARETGVTPQLAAVALAENFNRNDTWGSDPASDRFYVENAKKFIDTNLSENALSRFNEQRVVSESRQRQVGALRLQLDTLRSQAAKYGANVPPALAQNIQSLQSQILTATNGAIPEPTATSQVQAPVQQDSPTARDAIAEAAAPQPTIQQPTIQVPAQADRPIPQGQSGQVQLEPDAFDAKLTLQEQEYNRVQLRDYIETSGYREQLSATAPGSADRQLVIEALARRIQDDTRLTDAEKQGLLSAITGGN